MTECACQGFNKVLFGNGKPMNGRNCHSRAFGKHDNSAPKRADLTVNMFTLTFVFYNEHRRKVVVVNCLHSSLTENVQEPYMVKKSILWH